MSTLHRERIGEQHAPASSSLSFIVSGYDEQRASTGGFERAVKVQRSSDESEAVLAWCVPYRASRGQLRAYDAVAMTHVMRGDKAERGCECERARRGDPTSNNGIQNVTKRRAGVKGCD